MDIRLDIRYERFTNGGPLWAPSPASAAPRRAAAPKRAPAPRRWPLAPAMALCGALALSACVPPPSYGESSYKPGFSTYVTLPDGMKGRVYTTYLPDGSEGRTTGKVGNYTVDCIADSCNIEED